MSKRKGSIAALMGAVLALSASGYAATGGVHGFREHNRPSSPGNGHCGNWGGAPPCKHHFGWWHHHHGHGHFG